MREESYHQHMPNVPHGAMTTDELNLAKTKRVSKICPDTEMYKQCRTFKFSNKVASISSVSGQTSSVDKEPGFKAIAPKAKFSSAEELYTMHDKVRANVKNNRICEGFSFLVDSGTPLYYTVQNANSGNFSCTCAAFQRNSLCHHCIADEIKTKKPNSLVSNFNGRNLQR